MGMAQSDCSVESLTGEELSGVNFVRDYVEFHFDGPVLRALVNPRLELDGTVVSFPDQGSRDLLCALIGRTVQSVDARDGDCIRLAFVGGGILTIPFDDASHIGREGAHFQSDRTAPVQVWN
jgi:hypothetical protein